MCSCPDTPNPHSAAQGCILQPVERPLPRLRGLASPGRVHPTLTAYTRVLGRLDVRPYAQAESLGFEDEGGAAFGMRGDTACRTTTYNEGEGGLTVAFMGELTNLNYLATKGGVLGDKVRAQARRRAPQPMLRRMVF